LRGEPEIDQAATLQQSLTVNRDSAPKVSNQESLKRQLEYLRWADPPQFASIAAHRPDDPIVWEVAAEAPRNGYSAAAPTAMLETVQGAGPPSAPEDPPADSAALDELLAQEARALEENDPERLAAVRKKIESTLR
jgi:hypothetical protein